MAANTMPEIPASMADLPRHIAENPQTSMIDLIEPYRKYEAHLRTMYAQDRQNPKLSDPHLNVVPLFTSQTKNITTRARDLTAESDEEKSKYIMALPDDKRRPQGSPATVPDIDAFRKNFNVFSESSLVELDWNNVVAAGSSVINCLLPVPKEFDSTKRKLREYYHEKFCPASDVDLFLYGLTQDEAMKKIKQIERAVRDAILSEVTVVRTRYAITIASQYPVRHIQIVLRVYKSISEILTGFDIDAAGGAYDGQQVYVTPRALGSFITQINHIDLSRRSPSYENRLSKYSHRNFEVYWPDLDRSRIDPTIFERSFQRTLGLARLLILEALPTSSAREKYLYKRREERGRPRIHRSVFAMHGNIKDTHEDEVADWISEEEVSNYHTFSVPYGQKFNAKRIEKLCYTRDLLLNAEWNQSDKRQVYLHRHPAFFGRVEDVIHDCCGTCPVPKTEEEKEVAEKEAKIYISGEISFLIDDPGRQQIGSFNPLTAQDWTDMAYVGNTARLCQSIVNGDVEDVQNWLAQEDADPNKRDHGGGRSPLHLACTVSTPEVVKALIEAGARLTARLADGKTALHLAAARGHVEIIKLLMNQSTANEEAEEENQDRKRKAARTDRDDERENDTASKDEPDATDSEDSSAAELIDHDETKTQFHSMTTGSFVKVNNEKDQTDDSVAEDNEKDPDFYTIDVLAWDVPCSPLHLAIANGHEDAVRTLCDLQYGADAILPVKFLKQEHDRYATQETAAILTLVLALALSREKAKSMARLLLSLGATASQADAGGETVLYRFAQKAQVEVLDTLLENDKAGVQNAVNHLAFRGTNYSADAQAPVHAAINRGDSILLLKLLNSGAAPQIDFETWLKSAKASPRYTNRLHDLDSNKRLFNTTTEQPLMTAIRQANSSLAMELIKAGADPNSMTPETARLLAFRRPSSWKQGQLCRDVVRDLLTDLEDFRKHAQTSIAGPQLQPGMDEYIKQVQTGTYQYWRVEHDIAHKNRLFEKTLKEHECKVADCAMERSQRLEAVHEAIKRLHYVETALVARGGKIFADAYPDITSAMDTSHTPHRTSELVPIKPYNFSFRFYGDDSITETRKEGYIALMEAAWSGDIEKTKVLTMQAWGSQRDQPPLKMAIFDSDYNSPFSLAFLRGHVDLARCILDIVAAQWSPKDEDKWQYKLAQRRGSDSELEESCDESDSSDDEVRIISEKVNQTFTIDDIGSVSMQVKSHERPLGVFTKLYNTFSTVDGKTVDTGNRDLFEHCVENDDMPGLKALLELAETAQKLESSMPKAELEEAKRLTPSQGTFWRAISKGKTRLLSVLIKATGLGIPLDHLVKKSGLVVKEKPRFYQGLTVYGRKRKDWANAGRGMLTRTSGVYTSPLLHAAFGGSMDSVEFFLSDKPHRIYAEFSQSAAAEEDARLQHLKDSPGGFDRAISKWLSADNDLVIHCAVMAEPSQESCEVLEYLIRTCPGFLEKKNANGDTPLMIAYRFGRAGFAKMLIEANADQSTRNSKGENILHALLLNALKSKVHRLEQMMNLMDSGLRSHLFMQRNNLQENGETPLHSWVTLATGQEAPIFGQPSYGSHRRHYYGDDHPGFRGGPVESVAMLRSILRYSKGAELDVLNAAGDAPLHTAIRRDRIALVRVMVEHKPDLLHRENAVGRTPLEIAQDRLTAEKFKAPSPRSYNHRGRAVDAETIIKQQLEYTRDLTQEHDAEYAKAICRELSLSGEYKAADLRAICGSFGVDKGDNDRRLDPKKLKAVMCDFCETAAAEHPDAQRRLVSLNEANDVARRLGERFTGSRYFTTLSRAKDDDHGSEDEEETGDEEEEGKKKSDITVDRYGETVAWYCRIPDEGGSEGAFFGEKCLECKAWHE